MNILITICARAGSKRLPGKNIKLFCGKPLIEWTVIQAEMFREMFKRKNKIDIVICSDILHIQSKMDLYSLSFIHRPDRLNGDDVPKLEVIRYVHNTVEKNVGMDKYYDFVIDLDVTSPLRKLIDIEKAMQQYINQRCNSTLFSVVEAKRPPWFNQVIKIDHGDAIYQMDKDEYKAFDMNASIYIYNSNWLRNGDDKTPVQIDSKLYIMDEWQGFDIDTAFDFQLVQAIFKAKLLNVGLKQ